MNRWTFERAVLRSNLAPPARHILLTIAVVADWPGGTTPPAFTPSLTRLAELTGLSRRAVMTHLNAAEEESWVVRDRPPVERARAAKERTRYRLTIPTTARAPGAPDREDARAPDAPELGQDMPGARARDAQKPDRSQTNQTAAQRAEAIVLDATDATPAEARAVVALVEQTDQPRSLGGFLRRLAADGDLVTRLEKIRTGQQRQNITAAIETARQGPPCIHGEPGGANLHPTSQLPLCALCRAAVKRASA